MQNVLLAEDQCVIESGRGAVSGRRASLLARAILTAVVAAAMWGSAPAQNPDLSANGVSGPLTGLTGQMISVIRDVTNIGGPVASFTFDIRLSTNTAITVADPLLATFSNQTGFGPVVIQVPVPAGIAQGSYFVGLLVQQAAGETNLSNNAVASVQTINIGVGPPDLVAVALAGPTMAAPGQVVSVTRNVTNIGGALGGAFGYDVYLSTNNVITPADTLIASFISSTLGPLPVNVTIPGGTVPGSYFFGLVVLQALGETNTTNNVITGSALTVALVPPTVTGITPTQGPPIGGTTTIIGGTGFIGAPVVRFNGALATSVVVNSPTLITCVTPANPVGQPLGATVSVQTSSGTGSLPAAYTYFAPNPGSGGDLLLQTGVNAAPNQVPAKLASAGQVLSVLMHSPGGTLNGLVPIVGAQFFAVGSPPFGIVGFPQVHLDPLGAVIVFNGQLPLGVFFPLPPSGVLLTYQVPGALAGFAVRFQGFVLTPAFPGFIATDAHNFIFN